MYFSQNLLLLVYFSDLQIGCDGATFLDYQHTRLDSSALTICLLHNP